MEKLYVLQSTDIFGNPIYFVEIDEQAAYGRNSLIVDCATRYDLDSGMRLAKQLNKGVYHYKVVRAPD